MYRLISARAARYIRELVVHVYYPHDKFFNVMHKYSPFITTLCLEYITALTATDFKAIGERLPELQSLFVIRCGLVSFFFVNLDF